MTNERLEALKAERKRLLTPNAGTFVSAMELACQAIAALDELLALREAGDDEVVCLAEEYQLGETELHRIQTYKNLEGIAITRGQQLREALAEIERLSREHADILSECDLVSAGGEPGRFTIALKAKILPLIAAALEEQFYETPEAMNFFTLEVAGRRLGKMEITCRKCTGISPAERIDTLTAERDEARAEVDRLKAGKESGC